ncbi:MAG: hypothetical protein FJ304_22225, partial [Planctomycetes bacterium]|nr:hypothetical protein [Planctomycetota bacterium]
MSAESTVQLTAERDGKRHRVTVKQGDEVLHLDTLDVSSARARNKFLDDVCTKCRGIDRDDLDKKLMARAATGPTDAPKGGAEPHEVDVRSVVRPELFHTPEVSGITVPVKEDVGGKLVTRNRTYLRWASGNREVVDTPDRLTLPNGEVLYVAPDPGEPSAMSAPAWSADSRRKWLAGGDAPEPGAVFKGVSERIAHFLDFGDDGAAPGTTATLALWTILSYCYPAWDAVPYLSVGGPMGSGKSRVLDVLQRLAFRPLSSSNVTGPALFRTLHASGGVVLYDEAERLRQSTPDQQELISLFLAGYRRGGCATRLEPLPDGGFRPVKYDVYGPK